MGSSDGSRRAGLCSSVIAAGVTAEDMAGCWREGRSRWMCFLALWAGCVRGHSGNPHRLLLIGEGLSKASDPSEAQCPIP